MYVKSKLHLNQDTMSQGCPLMALFWSKHPDHNTTYYAFNRIWLYSVQYILGIRKHRKISLTTYFMDND